MTTSESLDTSEQTSPHESDTAGTVVGRVPLRTLVSRVVAAALLAVGAAFIPLAQYTCAMLLWRDSPMSVQPVLSDAGPIPAALVWHPTTYRVLTAVGGFPMAGALALYLAMAAGGGYVLLRTINPTFRVTTGVDWNRWILVKTYMHTVPLIKVIVTIVPVLVAVFFIWLVLDALLPSGKALSVATALLVGGACFLALSRNGCVGDCESGNYLLPSGRDATSLLARGAAFGGIVWLAAYGVLGADPERLLRLGRALGGLGESGWRPLAAVWLGAAALGGTGATLAAMGMGTPGLRVARRLPLTAAGLLVVLLLVAGTRWALPAHASGRLDYAWETAQPLFPAWWRDDGGGGAPPVMIAVPVEGTWRVRTVASRGDADVELSDDNVSRLRRHLVRRQRRTALAAQAYSALYEAACRKMDATARLLAIREGVRRIGEPALARTLALELWAQAGTEEALRTLPMLGDPRVFRYLTDDSRLPAGDLCARNGRIPEALRWYRLAGLPGSRAEERAARLMPVLNATLTGAVHGLPPGIHAKAGILPEGAELSIFLAGASATPVAPLSLREVARSAEVGPDGRFQLSHVPEGRYVLALWLSGEDLRRGVTVRVSSDDGAARPIRLSAAQRQVNAGIIRVQIATPTGGAQDGG